MRNCLSTLLLPLSILALLINCGGEDPAPATVIEPPPVFIISIDTLRSDRLPVYGYDAVATPAIDQFRSDGILFERAFSSVPMTLPSHTTILSGAQPYRHGVRDNIGYTIGEDLPMIQEILQRSGYQTGAAVSSYVLRSDTGISRGFSFYDDEMTEAPVDTISSWQRNGEESAGKLEGWIDSVTGRKIFGFLHIYEPHYPYTPPEPWATDVDDAYDGEVARSDEIVGRFLDFLREKSLYEESLIVILSDHGEGLGDHGELEHGVFLYREAIQVPLLVKLPGNRRAGETVAAPVSLTDIFPTVLALTGIEPPDQPEGIDLLGEIPADRAIYSETFYPRLHYGWSELFSKIDNRHHLIDAPVVELYDYQRDPAERDNIAAEQRRLVAAMREQLRSTVAAHPFSEPAVADPEDLAKLESLGYLGGGSAASDGSRPDPKDKIGLLTEFGKGAGAFQRGDLEQALKIGRSIVAENPDFLQAWGLISSASRKKGDYATALSALETQMERSPGNPQTALALSSVTYEMRRYDEARTYAELALDYAPAIANDLIARIEMARGNTEAAERAANASAAADSSRTEPLMLLSLIAHERGEIARELDLLNQVRAKTASGPKPPIRELEFRRGQALLQLRRTPEAEQAFRAEVTAFPDHRMAWVNLALVTGAQGRATEADAVLNQAIETNDDPQMRSLAAEARQVMNER